MLLLRSRPFSVRSGLSFALETISSCAKNSSYCLFVRNFIRFEISSEKFSSSSAWSTYSPHFASRSMLFSVPEKCSALLSLLLDFVGNRLILYCWTFTIKKINFNMLDIPPTGPEEKFIILFISILRMDKLKTFWSASEKY